MNASRTNPSGEEDRRLDLLVDGELSEEARRALLTQLDREPDGWRRCALAFLEAQTWKQGLAGLVAPTATQTPAIQMAVFQPTIGGPIAEPLFEARAARRSWNRRLLVATAMAASFLVALVLGMQLRHAGSGVASHRSPQDKQASSPDRALAEGAAPAPVKNSRLPETTPFEMVNLEYSDGSHGSPRSFELPATKSNQVDDAWVKSVPSAVSPELLKALKKQGHEVRQHREWVPLELQDGRVLVVPVDQVEIDNDKGPGL